MVAETADDTAGDDGRGRGAGIAGGSATRRRGCRASALVSKSSIERLVERRGRASRGAPTPRRAARPSQRAARRRDWVAPSHSRMWVSMRAQTSMATQRAPARPPALRRRRGCQLCPMAPPPTGVAVDGVDQQSARRQLCLEAAPVALVWRADHADLSSGLGFRAGRLPPDRPSRAARRTQRRLRARRVRGRRRLRRRRRRRRRGVLARQERRAAPADRFPGRR